MSMFESLHVGVVTGPRNPDLPAGARQLAAELAVRGASTRPVDWTADENVSTLDVVILRSCWDYHQQMQGFRTWLDALDDLDVTVLNPIDVVRWNVHKFYLGDLADDGVDVLATEFVEQGSDGRLADVMDERDWTEAVVKPAVGTSSTATWRTNRDHAPDHRDRFASMVAEGDVLVQQFAPEIRDGERSLVFFGGEFSHAFRREPAAGDFRAHPSFDATIAQYEPAASTVGAARRALTAVENVVGVAPSSLPYARVDGVLRDGEFVLMELELVEPWLGLDEVDGAVDRIANAIEAVL